MKNACWLVFPVLLSGCVNQAALQKMMDEKIAANNAGYIRPALAQQASEAAALADRVEANRQAILKSGTQVTAHQEVLLRFFRVQQETAAFGLDKLSPAPAAAEPPLPAPPTVPAP